jgi:hypothetical protein
VDFSELEFSGVPKDGIPAIEFSHFTDIAVADQWVKDDWPVAILIWHEIVNDQVLSPAPGFQRPHGHNPYPGYDEVKGIPLFPTGKADDRLPAMQRVAALALNGESAAEPFWFAWVAFQPQTRVRAP